MTIAFNTVLNPLQIGNEEIAIVDQTSGGANTLPLDARVISNFVQGAIWVETGSGQLATPEQEVVIANNICESWGNHSAMEVINDSVTENQSPLSNSYIVVQGNVLTGGTGLITSGSYMTIIGNVITCLSQGGLSNQIGLLSESTTGHIAVSATATNGSANLTGVVDSGDAFTYYLNVGGGWQITNASVPGGTYLLDGAGTASWTLSNPYTGTTSTQVFMAVVPALGMIVSNNVIHMPLDTGSVTDGVHITNFLYGSVNNNVVTFDVGSSGSVTGTGVGMTMSGCGNTDFKSNRIDHAPTHGISVLNSHDLSMVANTIKNASEVAGAFGARFSNVTGTNFLAANRIADTRASPRVLSAIGFATTGGGTNSGFKLVGNELSGFTANPLTSTTPISRMSGNVIDTTTDWPLKATTVTAASLPVNIVNSSPWPQQIVMSGGSAVVVNYQRGPSGTPVVISSSGGIGSSSSMSQLMLEPGDQLNLTGTTVPSLITATPMVY